MIDFFREAVLRLVEIKGTVGFSIKTFEDLLKWGANLHLMLLIASHFRTRDHRVTRQPFLIELKNKEMV